MQGMYGGNAIQIEYIGMRHSRHPETVNDCNGTQDVRAPIFRRAITDLSVFA